jgi:hypothetical protein
LEKVRGWYCDKSESGQEDAFRDVEIVRDNSKKGLREKLGSSSTGKSVVKLGDRVNSGETEDSAAAGLRMQLEADLVLHRVH